jgi:hypothetical protein
MFIQNTIRLLALLGSRVLAISYEQCLSAFDTVGKRTFGGTKED